jgi:dihydroorotase
VSEALLVRGGRVVDPVAETIAEADVRIADGRIAEIGAGLAANGAAVLDARRLLVAPGFVDLHVHLREPGEEGKETIATGTRAAALGGVTSVCCMPNTTPPLDTPAMIEYVLSRAAREGVVRVYPVGCISHERKGEVLADLPALKEAGAVAFSDDGDCVMNALLARRAMVSTAMLGVPYVEHAEDVHLVDGGVIHEGRVSLELGLAGRPAVAEDVIVARDLILAESAGAHLHVAHISSAGAVAMIREARRRGVRATCEVTPHHLALTDAAVGEFDTSARVNPPLRSEEHRQALIEGIRDGTIEVIATDHAPHGPLEKDVEFTRAAPGMLGLQTLWPLLLETIVRPGILPLERALRLVTSTPARIFGLPGGTLAVGAPGDLAVLDPEAEWTVDPAALASKSRNTPFIGRRMRGRVVHTIVAGRVVVRDGVLA